MRSSVRIVSQRLMLSPPPAHLPVTDLGRSGRRVDARWSSVRRSRRSREDDMSEIEQQHRRFYRVKEAAAIMGVPLRTM